MKKQLLAAAVATAVAAPMAATAGDVTIYGRIHSAIVNIDCDGACNPNNRAGSGFNFNAGLGHADFDGWMATDHWSAYGIKGTEDLGNGLSAFFQIENHFNSTGAGGAANGRNTFVGLAGDWGKIGIGDNDSPYKKSTGKLDIFSMTMGDNNQIGFDDHRMEEQIFYYSPNWNGFSFGAAIGFHADTGPASTVDADGVEQVSVAATYKNGPWFASLAYEEHSNEYVGAPAGNDEEKWRLGLGWTANGFHVGFIYEDGEDTGGAVGADYDVWQLSGSYTFGNNVLKLAYGTADNDTPTQTAILGSDPEQVTIGLDHKLSKRTKVYALYTDYDSDVAGSAGDYDALSLGIWHNF